MAKSKAKIEVEAQEKGVKMVQKDVENLASSSKKAGKEAQNLARNAATVDKNVKGAAGASANATKNFSKMQQGMGGLVGVYASFAAQIFAISAAFNFLKSAGDLQTLGASQQAYAASTGLAMRVLADDIIAATGAQISYQEASQAAAIGTSAGINPQQLTQLGKAAKDLSVTLGRDVTDSFNRLVRGVTKAEPELLDELGIILRLEDAQREYALSIGKTAGELTQFEKSQAVVNKVLQEADKVAANAPDTVNIYNQLGKAFDDVIIKLKTIADAIAGPIAKVFIDTPALAIASFGLLLKGPLAALGLNFKKITQGANESAAAMSLAAQKAKAQYEATKLTIESTTAAIRAQSAAAVAAGSKSKILGEWAKGGAITPQGVATIKKSLDAALRNVNQHGIIVKGIWKGMSVEVVMAYKLALEQMELAEQDKVSGTAVNVARINSLWATTSAKFVSFGAGVLKWGSRLISAFAWVSLLYTVFQVLNDRFEWFKKETDEVADALERQRSRIADLNREYKDFLVTQSRLIVGGQGLQSIANVGTMLGMTDTETFRTAVRDARAYQVEIDNITRMENKYANQGGEPSRYQRRFGGRAGAAVTMEQIKEAREALSNNEDLQEGANYIARIVTTLNSITGLGEANAFKPVVDFIEILQNPSASFEEIEAARVSMMEFASVAAEGASLLKNAEDSVASFLSSFAPVSEGAKAIDNIDKALDNIAKKREKALDKGAFDEEYGPEKDALVRNRDRILKFEKLITEQKKQQFRLDKEAERALAGIDNVLKPYVTKYYEVEGTQKRIKDLMEEQASLREFDPDITPAQQAANQDRIELIDEELRLLRTREEIQKEELTILQDQRDIRIQILKVSNEIAEKELEKRALEFSQRSLEVDKERLRIREELANIQAGRAERDFDRRTLFSDVGKEQRQAEQAYELELSLIDLKIAQTKQEFSIKKEIAKLENEILVSRLRVSAQELRAKAELPENALSKDSLNRQADTTDTLANLQAQQGSRQLQLLDDQEALAIAKIFDNLDKLKYAKDNLTDLAQTAKTMEDSLVSGLTGLFEEMIDGTQSFTDAFKRMAISVLKDIAKMQIQMMIFNAISGGQGMFSRGTYGTSKTLVGPPRPPGFADGGIMSNGKKMMGYASGGITSGSTSGYPAMLHGTEAVVPLPNGRSIPVEMSGSSQQNNVTVNVAIDNQGNATSQSSDQGANIGNIIAAAVQKELQNQKRSGGILSPYGTA